MARVWGRATTGLVIDLSRMKGIRIDPRARTVRVEGGCVWGDVDHAAHAFSLAVPSGVVSTTGVAGLTLGGGHGYLTRKYGLTIDNLLSADVALADGRYVTASAREHEDLFWAIRGGGGNFGVVTAIEYRVHPMNPTILGGMIMWPIEQARDAMRYYRNIAIGAPDVVNLEFMLLPGEKGPVCGVEVCWSGDRGEGENWLKPLRSFGKPMNDDIAPIPYVKLQAINDEFLAPGKYYYAKNGFLPGLDDAGIDRVLDVYRRAPVYALLFDQSDAAYRRVAPDASAFPNRDAMFWLGAIGVWPDQQGMDDKVAKMRAAWKELEPLTKGFYTNLSDPDATAAVYRENYGANFERLVALKAKYDPMNLFRLNANVPPKI